MYGPFLVHRRTEWLPTHGCFSIFDAKEVFYTKNFQFECHGRMKTLQNSLIMNTDTTLARLIFAAIELLLNPLDYECTCSLMLFQYRICRNKRPPRNRHPPKTVIFQRGEYTKPMAFDGWVFKGGSTQNRWVLMGDFSKGGVHKTDGFRWVLEFFFIASEN